MNLPSAGDERIDAIFGPGFAESLRQAAAGIDRKKLAEATPVSWIGAKEYEDISHDCA